MGWADKRWHEKVRAKQGSADLNKTSGTKSGEETDHMPVVIERRHQKLLKGPPPGAPYADIIAAWRAPMAPDTWAAYSKDLELWARAMGATEEEIAETAQVGYYMGGLSVLFPALNAFEPVKL